MCPPTTPAQAEATRVRASTEPGGSCRSQGVQAHLEGQLRVAAAKHRATLPLDLVELPKQSLSGPQHLHP